MSRLVLSLLVGLISTYRFLLLIGRETIEIKAKRQVIGSSDLCRNNQVIFEELQKDLFAKGDNVSNMLPPLLLGCNFDVSIFIGVEFCFCLGVG